MKKRIVFAIIDVLIVSIFPDVLIKISEGFIPGWVPFAKIFISLGMVLICVSVKEFKQLLNFAIVLFTISLLQTLIPLVSITAEWKSAFNVKTFVGNFSSAILLKLIGIIPLIGVLLFTLKSVKSFYLCKGDMSVKADEIHWLGIKKNWVNWGKLSLISAILISLGTILLTIITVTGNSNIKGFDKLFYYLPLILLFALVNSFCEGVLFRSAILGTLKSVFPKKYVVIIAALFFGIAHYYGAPGGVLGVFMSILLGWFMCRSMYETNGFLSSWIIHFMQDVVIFSTIFQLGGYQ